MFQKLSIKIRLTLLFIVIILPVTIFIVYGILSQYQDAKQNALVNLSLYVRAFSYEQNQSIEAARQLLISFSNSPEIISLNPLVCNTFLKN